MLDTMNSRRSFLRGILGAAVVGLVVSTGSTLVRASELGRLRDSRADEDYEAFMRFARPLSRGIDYRSIWMRHVVVVPSLPSWSEPVRIKYSDLYTRRYRALDRAVPQPWLTRLLRRLFS